MVVLFPLLLSVLFGGLFLGLWIYALISAIKNERLDSTMRIVWVLVIVLTSGLGALLYLFIAPGRPTRDERSWAEWRSRQKRRHAKLA